MKIFFQDIAYAKMYWMSKCYRERYGFALDL